MSIKCACGEDIIMDESTKVALDGKQPYHRGNALVVYTSNRDWEAINLVLLVLSAKDGYEVDHIDGNIHNVMPSNLRYATHAQNCKNRRRSNNNTSGYKGVSFHLRSGKWAARIKVNYKEIHLGLFATAKLAAEAYNKAARLHFGEFAQLNVI